MTVEELKKLLDEGKITREQFNQMAKAIDPDFTEEEDRPEDTQKGGFTAAEVEK